MNASSLQLQIRSMEVQLSVLKARLEAEDGEKSTIGFRELYGLLSEKSQSSEEEILAAVYRVDWDTEAE